MLMGWIGTIWKKLPRNVRRWLTRRAQTNFTISAAGIIVNEKGQVLLLNHVLRPVSGWGLPGGFIDAAEQPEEALKRELYEETGVELSHIRLIHARTLGRHVEIIFAAKAIGEPRVKSREITELRWFDLDDLLEVIGAEQRPMVLRALRPTD